MRRIWQTQVQVLCNFIRLCLQASSFLLCVRCCSCYTLNICRISVRRGSLPLSAVFSPGATRTVSLPTICISSEQHPWFSPQEFPLGTCSTLGAVISEQLDCPWQKKIKKSSKLITNEKRWVGEQVGLMGKCAKQTNFGSCVDRIVAAFQWPEEASFSIQHFQGDPDPAHGWDIPLPSHSLSDWGKLSENFGPESLMERIGKVCFLGSNKHGKNTF